MTRWGLLAVAVSGCAHRIELVTRQVTPPTPAAVPARACWVEYARSGPFTASGVAVHVPDGTTDRVVLVDAGQSLHFTDEIHGLPHQPYLRLVPGALVPKRPASEVLAAAGIDPAEIVLFVATHAHSDHLGGLMDLPPVPVRLHPAERKLLAAVKDGGAAFNVLAAEAERIWFDSVPLGFDDGAFSVFGESDDLLQNGVTVVVPIEGHTPGSVGVWIDVGVRRILYAGDAINTRSQVDRHPHGKGVLLRRTDADRDAADWQVGVLAGLHAADPELFLLPAHERKAWKALFGAPGGCVGATP